MKRIILYLWLLVPMLAFVQNDSGHSKKPKVCFSRGEQISYRVHYGFMNAAEGTMTISDKLYKVGGKVCYKVEIDGKSTGMFDVFIKIRDKWGSYIDTAALVPQQSYRIIKEGKYRKHEIVKIDQVNKKVDVKTYDYKKEKWKPNRIFETAENVQDLVSGYYYLRTLDFNAMNPGHRLSMDAFFEDSTYHFNMRFLGREVVKTKLGKFKALVISPEMPENSLFDGKDAIKVWISDDEKKIPLKVKASMFVGAVEIDIKDYKKGKDKGKSG